jgi:hypothetical protein
MNPVFSRHDSNGGYRGVRLLLPVDTHGKISGERCGHDHEEKNRNNLEQDIPPRRFELNLFRGLFFFFFTFLYLFEFVKK